MATESYHAITEAHQSGEAAVGRGLTVAGFNLTPTGITTDADPTFEQWQELGLWIRYCEGAVMWWLGDWFKYGEGKFGEMASQATERTGLEYGTLADAKWVAKQIDVSRRREKLTFAHHREVAPLQPKEQDRLLSLAEEGGWTRQQMRQAVAERKAELTVEAAPPAAAADDDGRPWRVIVGDCLEVLPTLTPGSARLAFADPPYNIGVDYGDGEDADLMPPAEFAAWLSRWVALCRDVLTPDGSLWLLISDDYAAEAAVAVKAAGFTLRNWIKWYETFGVNCPDKFNRTSRHLLYAVKGRAWVFNREAVSRPSDRQTKYDDPRADPRGKTLDDVWLDIPRLAGTHAERVPSFPTQLPLALLRRVVACASREGDLIVDPFNGSGTTGAAALSLGRRYVGIEKQEKFARLARARLSSVQKEIV